MDRPVNPSFFSQRKKLLAGIGVIALFGISLLAFRDSGTSTSVERHKVRIGTVEQGSFQELIAVSANVEPERTMFVPANEGGRIDELFVENGATVEAGQPLMRLSNAALMLDFMNRETQIIEQINNLRNTRITINQNKRSDHESLMQVEYQLKRIERQYTIDTSLYKESVIAQKDFEDSRDQYEYLSSRKQFLESSVHQDRATRSLQLQRIDASIDLMERNLEAIRANLENLVVKAPISGQLNSFDHVIGATIGKGVNVGRVDDLSRFIASAQVDEHYLGRIHEGLEGAFERGGKQHRVRVKKVLPTVNNRQFEVEMAFEAADAVEVRRGQSLQISLEMSGKLEATLLPRGGFYKETNGQWAYVLESDGRATKRAIRLGRQNNQCFEVLEGLEPGDRVVISTYDAFGEKDQLLLE